MFWGFNQAFEVGYASDLHWILQSPAEAELVG